MCYRTEDGTGACKTGSGAGAPFILKGPDGSPLQNVVQISGRDSQSALAVTSDGALYEGGVQGNMSKVIESGVISVSGGFNPACVLVEDGGKKGVRCGDSWNDPGLPADFDAMQVAAAYGYACALNKKGEAWCWGGSPNFFTANEPTKMDIEGPLVNISAGQNALCGTKLGGGAACLFSPYDGVYLPKGPGWQPDRLT